MIWGRIRCFHPCRNVLFEGFLNEDFNIDADVVLGLENVDAVIHIEVALALNWDRYFFVDEIHEDIGRARVRGSNRKVVNLTHEEGPITVEDPRVEARFMHHWFQADFSQNLISIFFPKLRGFGMALHG